MHQLNKKIYTKPIAVGVVFDCCIAFAVSMSKDDDAFEDDEIGASEFRSGSIWNDED